MVNILKGVDEKAYRKLILKRARLLKKVAEVEAEMSEMEQSAFRNSEFGKAYIKTLDSINKSYKKFDMDAYFDKLDKELGQDL